MLKVLNMLKEVKDLMLLKEILKDSLLMNTVIWLNKHSVVCLNQRKEKDSLLNPLLEQALLKNMPVMLKLLYPHNLKLDYKESAKNHHTNILPLMLKVLIDLIIKVKLEHPQKHNSVYLLVMQNHKKMKLILIIQMILLELPLKKPLSLIMLLVVLEVKSINRLLMTLKMHQDQLKEKDFTVKILLV